MKAATSTNCWSPTCTPDGELDTTKGLLALPEPSPGDLYLDLEGDPFAGEDGIDYLFGILEPSKTGADGKPLFHAFWSRDDEGRVTAAGEKAPSSRPSTRSSSCLADAFRISTCTTTRRTSPATLASSWVATPRGRTRWTRSSVAIG